MSNANEEAFPRPYHVYLNPEHDSRGEIETTGGLTKREYFAAMAMQGLVGYCAAEGHNVNDTAATAIQFADALLAEMGKSK